MAVYESRRTGNRLNSSNLLSVNGGTTASLAEDSVLEINASEFVKAGGGTTVLISAGVLADDSFSPQNISVDTGELRFAAEVLQENGKVTFKASPLNTVLIVR